MKKPIYCVVVSKPLDIFHAITVVNNISTIDSNTKVVWLLEKSKTPYEDACISYFNNNNIKYIKYHSGIIWTHLGTRKIIHNYEINVLNSDEGNVKKILTTLYAIIKNIFKVAIIPLAFLNWLYCFNNVKIILKNLSDERLVLLTDPWPSKLIILAACSPMKVILFDGGYSTISNAIIDKWKNGGPQLVLSSSLKGANAIGMPRWIKNRVLKTMKNAEKTFRFYTNYNETESSHNIYKLDIKLPKEVKTPLGKTKPYVLIIGSIVAVNDIILQYVRDQNDKIADVKIDSVLFRPHPRHSISAKEMVVLNDNKIVLNIPIYGLEMDLLELVKERGMPRIVYHFNSSSIVIIKNMLDKKTMYHEMNQI